MDTVVKLTTVPSHASEERSHLSNDQGLYRLARWRGAHARAAAVDAKLARLRGHELTQRLGARALRQKTRKLVEDDGRLGPIARIVKNLLQQLFFAPAIDPAAP